MLRALALCLLPMPALADGFLPIHDKAQFLALVSGNDLRLPMFDITLRILPDGQITGQAMGTPVSGNWRWQDGYFCRDMQWGKRPIDPNCQLVEVKGTDVMRFTVDRGAGDSAQFRLK